MSELHVRVQPDTAADALAAGVVLRSLRIADMPPLTCRKGAPASLDLTRLLDPSLLYDST